MDMNERMFTAGRLHEGKGRRGEGRIVLLIFVNC